MSRAATDEGREEMREEGTGTPEKRTGEILLEYFHPILADTGAWGCDALNSCSGTGAGVGTGVGD